MMLHESTLRRRGFRPGPLIRLADGHAWTFPGPPDRVPAAGEDPPGAGPSWGSTPHDPACAATVAAVLEAEDQAERLRAELALAIFLLASNYDLAPSDYGELLDYPPGDPALAAVQRAVHDLALDYGRALPPRAQGRPGTHGYFSIAPDRKAGFDVPIGRVFRGGSWRGATVVACLFRLLRSILSARRTTF